MLQTATSEHGHEVAFAEQALEGIPAIDDVVDNGQPATRPQPSLRTASKYLERRAKRQSSPGYFRKLNMRVDSMSGGAGLVVVHSQVVEMPLAGSAALLDD